MTALRPGLGVPRLLSDATILAAYDDDAETARRHFEAACVRAYGRTWTVAAGAGETIALGELGSADAVATLVVLSGVHGIEGVCGNAVQLALLERYTSAVPCGVRLLLAHIVNPWGMRHSTRTTADNVDLNRNIVPDHAVLANVGDDVQSVGRLFSSRHLAGVPAPLWVAALLWHIVRHGGTGTLRLALAGGQFFDSAAPFFGGARPAAEAEALLSAMARALEGARRDKTVFLDLHSGIGRFGETSLLGNGGDPIRAAEVFGRPVTPGHEGSNAVYPVRGDLLRGLKAYVGLTDATAATFECGTGSALATLLALRAATAARITGDVRDAGVAVAKMRRAFCPDDRAWRCGYVREALQVVDHALGILSKGAASHV